ncbi:MAG TPA: pyridoxal-phosphate dependent enzyme [Candidatus Krumholzibacteria bacterium]|nr:pyridoxal-phosphate dependent enzyme [Candidatus Krumholzibacteria bacterium]HPD72251.1 pyridoxal-phosphate dependent enzyme [Candidatus Krumholzibacteria bacterium]HRY40817.1 pyridoxal-phosphate dependent enzyme [Candidatus Krumholzibacteria bacterium]
MNHDLPDLAAIREAHARIRPYIHRTPVLTCRTLDRLVDAELFFKCENLQRVGAFKYRGATNAVQSLDDESARRGVATHSSGNHAQALALAARTRGIPAYVVMPRTAPLVKKAAVAGYGAEIVPCEPTLQARERTLAEVVARTGAHFVHPYDDPRVIAGQGTAVVELLEDAGALDAVITPVGGGGLLSGTALAVAALAPATRVLAAEPAGADDAARSLAAGRLIPSCEPHTICDGLLTSLSERTFTAIRAHVSTIVTVSDDAVREAMRLVMERMKLVVEPSAVVGLAALLEKRQEVPGRRIGIVISGGNVDLGQLPWQPAR